MIRFIPFESDSMKAFDGENEVGFCTFEINGYKMFLTSLTASDDIIAEGLIRSALNYGANRGAYIAQVNGGLFENVFRRLSFKGEELLSADIPEVLTSGCSCSHSK